jgi:SAM-dependent methyltransferase
MMVINRQKGCQYGRREWDEEYIKWGFKDEASQIDFAQKLLKIFPEQAKSILDVACGIGRYHKVWLENGYCVTGVDISEFFIENAQKNNPAADYYVCDAQKLPADKKYDIVTASEPGMMNAYIIRNIYKCLNPDGIFILESRNPNHPRSRGFRTEKRTWSYKNGIFTLLRHEFNFTNQIYESEEIIIDPSKDEIIIHDNSGGGDVTMLRIQETLIAAGFDEIETYSRDCEKMEFADESIYKIWLVAKK